MNFKIKYFCLILFLLTIPIFSYGQADRSYLITSFDANIGIKKDSTVDISEKINYEFRGTYNKGWRAISTKGIGTITDIYVVDVHTGKRLEYSSSVLEKTDSINWGKYAVTYTPGYVNVEWYYDESNSNHAWEIHYTVHGVIGFYDTFDEVYWNLFTEYEVPVLSVSARVKFIDMPEPKTGALAFYRTNANGAGSFILDDRDGYIFRDINIEPYEAVTIAIGFPKGLIEKGAYWKDLISLNWGFLTAFILILITIFYSIIFWYRNEYSPKHDKSIVPQYEPPKNMKPAQLDIIYNERLSKKSWSATIIDLAIKGYVKIEEDSKNKLLSILSGKDYKVHLLISESDSNYEKLETYEKNFLSALFVGRKTFSTKSMKYSQYESQELYKSMMKIEHDILEEIGSDYPDVYTRPVKMQNTRKFLFAFLFIAVFVMIFLFGIGLKGLFIYHILAIVFGLIFSFVIYLYSVKYNPRLSTVGNDTWRYIQGFRNYLYVAERYRMQNLTPEIFEKYLPYAMIFGIEKEWAKNFDSIVMQPPNWYSGSSFAGVSASQVSGAGFSASGFSTSFTTSFSSAFSAAGGSGSSGGGGSAGGGGGGGGGGAS